jgi:multicomponent Na+:H+ antiporter subunit F
MDSFFIGTGVALCLLMLLTLHRAIHGPTAIDRIMGVNVLLNFIVAIAASRYFQHRKNLNPKGYGFRYRSEGEK